MIGGTVQLRETSIEKLRETSIESCDVLLLVSAPAMKLRSA